MILPDKGAIVIEKYDPEEMRLNIYKKAEHLFRAKSKLVKIFGKYYYKSLNEDEVKSNFNKFFQVEDRQVNTEQELADFLAKEQCIRDPYDEV